MSPFEILHPQVSEVYLENRDYSSPGHPISFRTYASTFLDDASSRGLCLLIGQLDLDAPRDPRRELLHREIKRSMIIFSWTTALDFAFGRVAPHDD